MTIVGVALPTIQQRPRFSVADQRGVVTADTLTLGGLLLLSGRSSTTSARSGRSCSALAAGYTTAFAWGAAALLLGGVLTTVLIRTVPSPQTIPAPLVQ